MKSPWKRISSTQKYKNKWLRVREDTVFRPDGTKGIYGVVETSGSSAIVALTKKNEINLIKQWRYPLNRLSIELPWGGQKKGESGLQCAKRELKEETGLTAKKWNLLTRSSVCPGIVNEDAYIYLAQGLTEGRRKTLSEESDQTVVVIPFKLVYQWIMKKKIHDAVTIAGVLLAKEYLKLK